MTPAFQVKEFLTLSGTEEGKSFEKKKTRKVSTKTQFVTKFCCRQENLKELLSFYNVAGRAISNSNSYTNIIGLAGEGGIGKSRLVTEFIRKVSSGKNKNVIKINYSDKNNLIFQNEFEIIRDTLETKIKTINKSNLPAVIVLEDLHWYEAEEKKKIEKLLFAFSGELPIPYSLSVIIIATYRITKTGYNFQKFDSFEDMQLMPLSESESNKFIKHSSLLKKNKISKKLKEKIISLSAGIPFYIEEFLKSFTVENGKEIIPDSIERLLSYKLSFIDTEVVKVLQIIAAWDGSINEEIFENICHKLRLTIYPQKILLQSGIIRVENKNGEVSYSFTHDIYKNYIAGKTENYFAIIIHKTIAGIFEKSHTKSEHILFKLYYHFKNCNEPEKAYEYLENYINKIAEQREFESALQRIDELIEYYATNEKKKLEIWLLKIKCLRELIRKGEMEVELKNIGKKIKKYKSSELYLRYLYQLEGFYFISNELSKCFRIIKIGLKKTKEQNNILLYVGFLFLFARSLNIKGKILACIKASEKLVKVSHANNLMEYHFWGNLFLASNLQKLGNYSASNLLINSCEKELKTEGISYLIVNFINLKGMYYYYKKDYSKYVNILRDVYKIESNFLLLHSSLVTLLNIADCLIVLNEINEAKTILDKLYSFTKKNGISLFFKRVLEGYLNLHLGNEDYKQAENISLQLIGLYDKNDYKNLSEVYSNLIIIYFNLNKIEYCHECYKKSLFYSQKMGKLSSIVICHYNLGFALYLLGKLSEAEKYIKKAYRIMSKYLNKDFNFEINFILAEINLIKGKIYESKKILERISDCIRNIKETQLKDFQQIFFKLVLNSKNKKQIAEYLLTNEFNKFVRNKKIEYIYKLRIMSFIKILNYDEDLKLKIFYTDFFKTTTTLNIHKNNKIITFYLKKI